MSSGTQSQPAAPAHLGPTSRTLTIMLLGNQIQHYEWGRRNAVRAFLGKSRMTHRPEAEMWMGAHPKASSWVAVEKQPMPLLELILDAPSAVLGGDVVRNFGLQLPFLMKLLAAARPLSIQAHPDQSQARIGFDYEEANSVAIDDVRRNYKDPNHKPEVICALTDFWALKGFRPVADILNDFKGIAIIQSEWNRLGAAGHSGLRDFLESLTRLDRPRRQALVGELVGKMATHPSRTSKGTHAYWIVRLDDLYPNDIGVAVALMLNLVPLQKWDALYVPAGELHAYLEGTGVELMANSDNVLRAGLTPKNIDVIELLNILACPAPTTGLVPTTKLGPTETLYDTPATEFKLSRIALDATASYVGGGHDSVEILFVVEGKARITDLATREVLPLSEGRSVFVPAAVSQYEIANQVDDKTVIFRATVP